jgi:hypothetical protein
MIDPLLTSLFLLVLDARWLLRPGQCDTKQKWETADTELAPPSSA